MSYFLAFAGFAALIILHEAGHFVAAKAVGMRVERFSLFFPPLVARWRPKGSETEYAIGAIPLGGYVKITGMNPEEVMAPEIADRAYFRQPVWKRVVVIAAGPAVNIVLAFLILWMLFLSQGRPVPGVGVLETQAPPASEVLQEGDLILSVDGVRGHAPGLSDKQIASRAAAMRKAIGAHACAGKPVDGCRAAEPVRFVVRRGERTLTLPVTPRYDAEAKRMLVGFAFGAREDLSLVSAARY
ncbi:MAG: M50 family metallopeptidase, partial [Solirubrobacteraceae bacterium]